MMVLIRSRVVGETRGSSCSTRLTVLFDTPASLAISLRFRRRAVRTSIRCVLISTRCVGWNSIRPVLPLTVSSMPGILLVAAASGKSGEEQCRHDKLPCMARDVLHKIPRSVP